MVQNVYDEFLGFCGKKFGVGLKFDESDACTLLLADEANRDNPLSLIIRKDERRASVVLMGVVAEEAPEVFPDQIVRDLLGLSLGAMVNGAPAIGLDPASAMLLGYVVLPVSVMTESDCGEAIEQFIEFLQTMTDRFRKLSQGVPDDEDESDDTDAESASDDDVDHGSAIRV